MLQERWTAKYTQIEHSTKPFKEHNVSVELKVKFHGKGFVSTACVL